jgi:hypothetical protein
MSFYTLHMCSFQIQSDRGETKTISKQLRSYPIILFRLLHSAAVPWDLLGVNSLMFSSCTDPADSCVLVPCSMDSWVSYFECSILPPDTFTTSQLSQGFLMFHGFLSVSECSILPPETVYAHPTMIFRSSPSIDRFRTPDWSIFSWSSLITEIMSRLHLQNSLCDCNTNNIENKKHAQTW